MAEMANIHIPINVSLLVADGCLKFCPFSGLVFSCGPDFDCLYAVRKRRTNPENEGVFEKERKSVSMEKIMLVGQKTTARVLSFKGSDGQDIKLPVSYDVFWSASAEFVSIDTTSSGECIVTTLNKAGETVINASVRFTDSQGVLQTVSDTIRLIIKDREVPPPPTPIPVGLNFEIDQAVDVPFTRPEILVASKSIK